MKLVHAILILMLLAGGPLPGDRPAVAQGGDVPKKRVEINFQKVEGAKKYRVRIYKKTRRKRWRRVFQKTLKNTRLVLGLKEGEFFLVTRAVDHRGAEGKWGKRAYFEVKIPKEDEAQPVAEQEETTPGTPFKFDGYVADPIPRKAGWRDEVTDFEDEDFFVDRSVFLDSGGDENSAVSRLEIDTLGLLTISQEEVEAAGVVGEFKGDGVNTGMILSMNFWTEGRKESWSHFTLEGTYEQFESIAEETNADTGVTQTRTTTFSMTGVNLSQYVVLRMDGSRHYFTVGGGARLRGLPLFKTRDEATGEGKLVMRNTWGLGGGGTFHLVGRSWKLRTGVEVMPISMETDQYREWTLRSLFDYGFTDSFFVSTGGQVRYLLVRYTEQCSSNEICTHPRTEDTGAAFYAGLNLEF